MSLTLILGDVRVGRADSAFFLSLRRLLLLQAAAGGGLAVNRGGGPPRGAEAAARGVGVKAVLTLLLGEGGALVLTLLPWSRLRTVGQRS